MPGYLNIRYSNYYNYFNRAGEEAYLINKCEAMAKHLVGLTLSNISMNLKKIGKYTSPHIPESINGCFRVPNFNLIRAVEYQ
jgi:hypothetical protein